MRVKKSTFTVPTRRSSRHASADDKQPDTTEQHNESPNTENNTARTSPEVRKRKKEVKFDDTGDAGCSMKSPKTSEEIPLQEESDEEQGDGAISNDEVEEQQVEENAASVEAEQMKDQSEGPNSEGEKKKENDEETDQQEKPPEKSKEELEREAELGMIRKTLLILSKTLYSNVASFKYPNADYTFTCIFNQNPFILL